MAWAKVEVDAELATAHRACISALHEVIGCMTSHRDPTFRSIRAICRSRNDPVLREARFPVYFDLEPITGGRTRVEIRSEGHYPGWGNPRLYSRRAQLISELADYLQEQFSHENTRST
jgi:hypothetical protein